MLWQYRMDRVTSPLLPKSAGPEDSEWGPPAPDSESRVSTVNAPLTASMYLGLGDVQRVVITPKILHHLYSP